MGTQTGLGWALQEGGLPQRLPWFPQEGMLKELQKSVEDEEQVWKAKLSRTEEELQKVLAGGAGPQHYGCAGPLHVADPHSVPASQMVPLAGQE